MAILRKSPEHLIGSNIPEVKNIKLSNGVAGNMDAIEFMSNLAIERSKHPVVRSLALRIIEQYNVGSNDYINEALALGDWVKKKTHYRRDITGVETIHDPLTMIDMIKRNQAHLDCDDQATLLVSLLLSIGHQPFFRVVRYKPSSKSYNHIYVVVYEKNHNTKRQRVVLDPILKRKPIGFEVKHASGKEIKVI
jgi:hypothetical protein